MEKILDPENFIKDSMFKTLEEMLDDSPEDFAKVLKLEKNPRAEIDKETMEMFDAIGLLDPAGGLHNLVENALESLRRVNWKVPKRNE